MDATAEERLIEKLRKIEALFARSTTAGERDAAGSARDRILRKLTELEQTEAPIVYRFSMPDGWSRSLFVALLQRYGLKPYRHRGQRRTTVMVRVAASFVDQVLWPEFQQLNRTLSDHLESVTRRVVDEAIHRGSGDVEERPDDAPETRWAGTRPRHSGLSSVLADSRAAGAPDQAAWSGGHGRAPPRGVIVQSPAIPAISALKYLRDLRGQCDQTGHVKC
jgi:hypothetical protein